MSSKGLEKEMEPGAASAKQEVELREYSANLVFDGGENIVCFQFAYRVNTFIPDPQ